MYQKIDFIGGSLQALGIVMGMLVLVGVGFALGKNSVDQYQQNIISEHERWQKINQHRFEVICARAPQACVNPDGK